MEVTDLSARCWVMNSAVDAHSPIAALKEAIRQIEAGEMLADHVIIAVGSMSDDAAITDWLQAGSFNVFAQRGLMAEVQMAMFDAGEA